MFAICHQKSPPRQVDVYDFFDTILTGVYNFQSLGKLFICGDLNSRCGAEDDFIVVVDDIVQRNIIDYKTNNYGQILIEFLINSNMCILNGRTTVTNDFTSVSSNGTWVVDNCIVNHEDLSMFQNFQVLRVNDMLNASGAVGRSFFPTSLPDHSCFFWHISAECFGTTASEVHEREAEHEVSYRYDTSPVPELFLGEGAKVDEISRVITELETCYRLQSGIDRAYPDFCSLIWNKMTEKLPRRKVNVKRGTSNKRRRVGKPWWNDDLTTL